MKGFNIHFTEKVSGVYAYIHIATGRMYIGSSVNIYRRHSKHLSDLKAGRHHSPKLRHSWGKHSQDAFCFTVLEVTPADRASILAAEQRWIDERKPYYNTCKVATSVLGVKRSEETKARLSAALAGKVKTPEHIEKTRLTSTGRTHSEETKRLCGIAAKRAARPKHSQERRDNTAASKAKEFVLTKPDGTEMNITNLKKFCRDNELDQGNMSKVLRGAAAHHKGWRCRYANIMP